MHLLQSVKKAISKIEASLKQHYWHGEPPQRWQDFFDDPNNTELSPHWSPGVKNATHVNQEAPKNTTLNWYGIDNQEAFLKQKQSTTNTKKTSTTKIMNDCVPSIPERKTNGSIIGADGLFCPTKVA